VYHYKRQRVKERARESESERESERERKRQSKRESLSLSLSLARSLSLSLHTHTQRPPAYYNRVSLCSCLAGKVAEIWHCEKNISFCSMFYFPLEKCCSPKALFLPRDGVRTKETFFLSSLPLSLPLSLSLSLSFSLSLSLSRPLVCFFLLPSAALSLS